MAKQEQGGEGGGPSLSCSLPLSVGYSAVEIAIKWRFLPPPPPSQHWGSGLQLRLRPGALCCYPDMHANSVPILNETKSDLRVGPKSYFLSQIISVDTLNPPQTSRVLVATVGTNNSATERRAYQLTTGELCTSFFLSFFLESFANA